MEKVLENPYQTSASSLDNVSRKSANLIAAGSNVSAGIAGGGPSGSGGGGTLIPVQAPTNSTAVLSANASTGPTNMLTGANTANGGSTHGPHQQIIQVSSQAGGSIVPGQQLMVQTFQGRQAIQIRAQGGQQIQQIQFIPLGSLPGQAQRQPVIIQQQNPSVLHSTVNTQNAITSMANLAHSKIASVQSSASGKPSPVIIQQSTGALLHGQATAHGLHHHNVAKITTVSRTPTGAVRPQPGKMINISTAGLAHHITGPASGNNHTTVTTTTLPASAQTAGGQVTRLGIISQLPTAAHGATVSTVHGAKPILNLTTATLAAAKSVILNPAGSVVQPAIVSSSGTMHNVVGTFNGPTAQFKTQPGATGTATNLIPTVMTLATLATTGSQSGTRHTLITTQPATSLPSVSASQAFRGIASGIANHTVNLSSSPISTGSISITSTANSNLAPTITIPITCSSSISLSANSGITLTPATPNTHSNMLHNTGNPTISSSSINNTINNSSGSSAHLSTSISGSTNQMSPLRPNILTSTGSPLNSPIKQPIGQQTPSSPRPSILIRKRVTTLSDADVKSNSAINLTNQFNNAALTNSSNVTGLCTSSAKLLNSLGLTNKPVTGHTISTSTATVRACDFVASSAKMMNNSSLKKTEEHLTAMNLSVVSNASSHCNNNAIVNNGISNSASSTNRLTFLQEVTKNQSNHTNENSVPIGSLNNNCSISGSDINASMSITPRKRRKQLLEPFTLTTSQNIKLLNSGDELKSALFSEMHSSAIDDDLLKKKDSNAIGCAGNIGISSSSALGNDHSLSASSCRRSRPSLMTSYNVTWRSLQNHFQRHCEVKVKPDKRSINSNEQCVESVQKRNGWKVHHLGRQLRDLIENEASHAERMQRYLKVYDAGKACLPDKVRREGSKPYNKAIAHNSITILEKLSDLLRANIQRSNLFQEQIRETNQTLLKLTNEHRERVNKLSKRCSTKRNGAASREKKAS